MAVWLSSPWGWWGSPQSDDSQELGKGRNLLWLLKRFTTDRLCDPKIPLEGIDSKTRNQIFAHHSQNGTIRSGQR